MKKEKKHLSDIPTVHNMIDEWGNRITDPLGSYTGVPTDPYDQPIQDADDL